MSVETVELVRLKSSELRAGMVVRNHGMRLLLGEVQRGPCLNETHGACGEYVYWSSGYVLNIADVDDAWIRHMCFDRAWRDGYGWLVADGPYWTVKGNDLAYWYVEQS